MIDFVECGMAMQDFLMILLEICLVLELILLLVRITCFSGKKKIVTAVAVFVVSFMFMGALMNDHRYCLGESSYQPMLQGYPVSVLMTVVIGLLLFREKENRNGSGCLYCFFYVHGCSDE